LDKYNFKKYCGKIIVWNPWKNVWNLPGIAWNTCGNVWNPPGIHLELHGIHVKMYGIHLEMYGIHGRGVWNPCGIHGTEPFHVDSTWNVGSVWKSGYKTGKKL